jgi:hypothetical protein
MQDWAAAVATNILHVIRQTLLAAIAEGLSDPELHGQMTRLLRDELSVREQDLRAEILNQNPD